MVNIANSVKLMKGKALRILDYCKQNQSKAAFVNIDQEKVFDRVNWSFMYSTLDAFGLSKDFVKWIRILYTDPRSSVIVNNYISDYLPLSRSVRQGCGLSSLLYV